MLDRNSSMEELYTNNLISPVEARRVAPVRYVGAAQMMCTGLNSEVAIRFYFNLNNNTYTKCC